MGKSKATQVDCMSRPKVDIKGAQEAQRASKQKLTDTQVQQVVAQSRQSWNYLANWYPLYLYAIFQAVCAIGTYGGLAVPRFPELLETVPRGITAAGYQFVVQRASGSTMEARTLAVHIQHALDVLVPQMAAFAPRAVVSNVVYAGSQVRIYLMMG